MYEFQNMYGMQPNMYGFGSNMAKNVQNQQVIKVNGSNGAQAYQLAPNCSALLLDETAPRVFLAQTDGAGYKTITAYKLEPYVEAPAVSNEDLLERIKRLEERLDEQSNNRNGQSSKPNFKNAEKSERSVQ